MVPKEKAIILTIKDLIMMIGVIAFVGGAVAYAHTKFAYRDDVVEIRRMVLDLWKHQGLHRVKKK